MHFKRKLEEAYLMIPDSMCDDFRLNQIGLNKIEYVISVSQFHSQYKYCNVHVVAHHYGSTINTIKDVLQKHEGAYTLSFFADGYTNVFLDREERDLMLKTCNSENIGSLFSFDCSKNWYKSDFSVFKNVTVTSERFIEGLAVYKKLIEDFKSKIEKLQLRKYKVIIFASRPWGTPGIYPFTTDIKSDVMAKRVGKMIKALNAEHELILYKGDTRFDHFVDPILVQMRQLQDTASLFNLDDIIPKGINFDPFLLFLLQESKAVTLISLDSTLPLPFIAGKMAGCYKIGFPFDYLEDIGFDSDSIEKFAKKIKMYEDHFDGIGQEYSTNEGMISIKI